jgi:hypothetical protein
MSYQLQKINSKWINDVNIISETMTTVRKQGKHFKTVVWTMILFWMRLQKHRQQKQK